MYSNCCGYLQACYDSLSRLDCRCYCHEWAHTNSISDLMRQEEQMDGQTLKSGSKKDEGKPRMDLLSPIALTEIAKVMTFGAQKYEANNWRKGIAWSRVIAAVLRHIFSWLGGEDKDPETGISHLGHASCGLMFLLDYEVNRREYDDRYKGHSKAGDIRVQPSHK